jgi:hypothetical protein
MRVWREFGMKWVDSKGNERREENARRITATRLGKGECTLLGRYEAIDAVKTIEPLTPCFMNARAAQRAE